MLRFFIRRVLLVIAVAFALFALRETAFAQPREPVKVVGVLSVGAMPSRRDEVFEQRLRELGWVDRQNLRLEYRRAGGDIARLPALASELLRAKVDVLVATSTPAVKAAKGATRTVPIVSLSADPLGNRFVESLARPGGNLTGVSLMAPELLGKSFELLRESSPKLEHVAYLAHGDDPSHRIFLTEAQGAGRRMGTRVLPVVVRSAEELDEAFSVMKSKAVGAAIVQPIFGNVLGLSARIAELAVRHRLAAISAADVFADAGGLLSHSPDPVATYQLVADYVDRVLRGANPGDLPIQQPGRFVLAVNVKTAKRIGIEVPRSLLLRADRVIE